MARAGGTSAAGATFKGSGSAGRTRVCRSRSEGRWWCRIPGMASVCGGKWLILDSASTAVLSWFQVCSLGRFGICDGERLFISFVTFAPFHGANQPLRLVRPRQKTCANLVG